VKQNDHTRYDDTAAAYLLGALSDLERQAFERHLAGCASCREDVERLRPAADALPRSVTPLAPPPSIKASLMEVVERETSERRPTERQSLGERLRNLVPSLSGMRPAAAWVSASFLLAVGLLTGYGVSRVVSGDESRTITASADRSRVPDASGSLRIEDDGEDGAVLRVYGLPSPGRNHVYQAWVERDGEIVPQSTFDVSRDGSATPAVTEDLGDADQVMVTREVRGGARAPSEPPVLRVRL
jgi:anti-sigma-K factor RskA/putative zinc finger protein